MSSHFSKTPRDGDSNTSILMLGKPFSEGSPPDVQPELPWAQLEAISSCPVTSYLREEAKPHPAIPSFQAVVERDNAPLSLLFTSLNNLYSMSCSSQDLCSTASPAPLPLSRDPPAAPCPSWSKGPKTEHKI